MAKHGYFVDEETMNRLERMLCALNQVHTLMQLADNKAINDMAELFALLSDYAEFDVDPQQYGQWIKQEASHVQKPL